MSTYSHLSKIFRTAMEIPFDDSSKIVLISDCHKGDGSWVDDFIHNQNLYYCALKYYYKNGFTYIDLGDSDELWKNKNFDEISNVYTDIFALLHAFYVEKRFYMIYGNHDIIKKYPPFVKKHLSRYYDSHADRYEPLFEGIRVHEGLILKHTDSQTKLLLIHGHQGDLLNDTLWRLCRFLARTVWRRLEFFGYKDPTRAAKNYEQRKKVERKIIGWVAENHQIVVAGHTHRPTCPPKGEEPYFNDGSCVHPNCITCIEIVNSELTLVKWDVKTRADRSVYVDKEPIARPWKIDGEL